MPDTPPTLAGHWARSRESALAALRRGDLAAAAQALAQLESLLAAAEGPAAARARAHAEIGDLAVLLEDYSGARRHYGAALALDPRQARFWFNRATVQRFLGDLAAAERDYDACLELDPADAQAWLNRSELRQQTAERNHLPQLEQALQAALGQWQREVPLRYALAKEYEDLGEWPRAWAQLSAGAALRRRHLEYDVRADLAALASIRDAFPDPPSAGVGAASPGPIFILGLPRTGSTLVERILGRHSQVQAAGELPHFGAAVVDAVQRRHAGRKLPRSQLIAESARLDFTALGADYLRRTRPRAGQRPFFTDKLPLNFLYCGLIARALPHARLVHVIRGPMATCYSIYKVLFDRGYPFSYDLNELADYYVGYRALMAHWERTLPGRLVTIRYETLLDQPQGTVERLLGELGLPWEPHCLAFEDNPAPVATASAAQVRRPLYRESRSLWRRYVRELAPLAARLEAAGIAIEP
ncbi:MAG: sulfotransferase [Proteobacteria bacterium]|nr:sulfotransferase [Pseudomonadota bacterium]